MVVLAHRAEGLDVAYSMELAVHDQQVSVEHAFVVKDVANPAVAIYSKTKGKI